MLCGDLQGWDGGGRLKKKVTYVYIWLIHVVGQQKLSPYCHAVILQLKKKKKNYCLKVI